MPESQQIWSFGRLFLATLTSLFQFQNQFSYELQIHIEKEPGHACNMELFTNTYSYDKVIKHFSRKEHHHVTLIGS